MYYDDYELPCGCRMHCRCDKVGRCERCGETVVLRHSSGGHFCPHNHVCKPATPEPEPTLMATPGHKRWDTL